MALAGKDLVVQVATGSTATYATVADLNSATMTHAGNTIDVSEMGVDYVQKILGLKDVSYSLGGFYAPTDTNGQVRIRNAWLNDTALWIKFLPDGSTGFKQAVKVASFEISGSADGAVELSVDLEGDGAVANS